jgi:predicted dehydrogenase
VNVGLTYAPAWADGSWLTDPTKSGGIALDLHIHDLDFIQHLFGPPKNIHSAISKFDNGTPGHVLTTLDYGDDRAISATAGWMTPESFGFKMAFIEENKNPRSKLSRLGSPSASRKRGVFCFFLKISLTLQAAGY